MANGSLPYSCCHSESSLPDNILSPANPEAVNLAPLSIASIPNSDFPWRPESYAILFYSSPVFCPRHTSRQNPFTILKANPLV
ncbi:unnamed protein product [Protopolystoma xenopodis]|uniref:Uncharacterized protein n=1 Tax=Protopolystoma xenopodis TaxID=117903 RepID=A0A448WPM1_9PLAT|nr:unnamed protein product [Protopolystoma xenopodis]